MALSSDDEDVVTRRRSAACKFLDSDDEEEETSGDAPSGSPTPEHGQHSSESHLAVDVSEESVKNTQNAVSEEPFEKEQTSSELPVSKVSIMEKLNALAGSESESDVDADLNLSDVESPLKSSHSHPTKKVDRSKHALKRKQKSQCASESDSEVDTSESNTNKTQRGNKESKPRPDRKSKTVAKSAMLEIKAQSQRRLREANVGLPYHIPKERTLSEFLNRRRTSSIPIKGPADTLARVWKEIEEREKEAAEFYKSESDSDSNNEDSNNSGKKDGSSDADLLQKDGDPMSSSTGLSEGIVNSGVSAVCSDNITSDSVPLNSVIVDKKSEKDNNPSCQSEQTVAENSPTEFESEDFHLCLTETQSIPLCTQSEEQLTASSNAEICLEEVQLKSISQMGLSSEQLSIANNVNLNVETLPKENLPSYDSENFILAVGDSESWQRNDSLPTNANCSIGDKDEIEPAKANSTLAEDHFRMSDSEEDCEDITANVSKSVVKELSSDALKSAPRFSLKGTPDEIIVLDGPAQPTKGGVHSLMERFLRHTVTKSKPSSPQIIELSVISSEKDGSGDIININHESVKVSVAFGEESSHHDQKPGAKLKLLKSELVRQMKKQKEEEWQKRQEELKTEEESKVGEKEECDGLPDYEDEEEEDLTETETESEPEINDVREPKERIREKNKFLDEEAEVDEDAEESDNSDDLSDDLSENLTKEKVEAELHSSDEEEKQSTCEDTNELNGKFCDASEKATSDASQPKLKRSATSADLFASQCPHASEENDESDDDFDLLPPGQSRPPEHSKDVYGSSPLSSSKRCFDTQESDLGSIFSKSPWLQRSHFPNGVEGLLTEKDDLNTQDKFNELIGLCSGKFSEPVSKISELVNHDQRTSESDLMALCSGKFLTQDVDMINGDSASPTPFRSQTTSTSQISSQPVEESQDFTLKFDEDSEAANSWKTKKSLELEMVSSDEEDALLTTDVRKKIRKLEFSDEEDDGDRESNLSVDSASEEGDIEDEGQGETSDSLALPRKEIMYDSDENEIEPAHFFDNEAELSEEEWEGSEDEDEAGLDQLEMNEADKEDIDQDKMREDLAKSHLQKVMDEDRRDVRILQELFLEDGELHSEGGGRERQFRWRNVDVSGMSNDVQGSDDENGDNADEDEEDAEWRKRRHEREMFLKQQQEKRGQEVLGHVQEDELLQDSELLQLGKAVLLKCRSNSMEVNAVKEPQVAKPSFPNPLTSPDGKHPLKIFAKRGSFLSRNDGVLAKFAKINGSSKESGSTGAKTSGNFVFAAISPPKVDPSLNGIGEIEVKAAKRNATGSVTNPKVKRPCLPVSEKKRSGLFDHL